MHIQWILNLMLLILNLLWPFQVLCYLITPFYTFLSIKSPSRPWLTGIFRLMKRLSHSSLTLCFKPCCLEANPALTHDPIRKG